MRHLALPSTGCTQLNTAAGTHGGRQASEFGCSEPGRIAWALRGYARNAPQTDATHFELSSCKPHWPSRCHSHCELRGLYGRPQGMDLLRSSLSPGEEQEFAAHRPVHHGEDDAQEQMQSSYLDDQQHFSQNSFAEALLFAQVLYLPCSYSLLLSACCVLGCSSIHQHESADKRIYASLGHGRRRKCCTVTMCGLKKPY